MMKLLILLLIITIPLALFAQDVKQDSVKEARLDSLKLVYHPGEHDIILMPGARAIPEGSFYFAVYEIFLYNFSYGITPSTQAGLFFPLPAIPGFEKAITLNLKQNVFDLPYLSAALHGTITFSSGLFTGGGIITLGNGDYNINASYMYGGLAKEKKRDGMFLLGTKLKVYGDFNLIAEYLSFEEDWDIDGFSWEPKGILTVGARFIIGFSYIDFTAITTAQKLRESKYEFFPLLKFGVYF